MDVAQALYSLCVDKSAKGKTFILVGDEEYTQKEIVDYILDMTSWKRKRFRFCSNTTKAVICKKLQDTINFYYRLLWYCIMPKIIAMCNRTYSNLISSHLLLLVLIVYIILYYAELM